MNAINWSGMNVLVTGAAGFIGQSVVAELLKRGHKVRAMVRKPEQITLLRPAPGLETVAADVIVASGLPAVMHDIDVVIHLAGVVWGEPARMYGTMVDGTANLIEAMGQVGVSRLILASSLAVYDWCKIKTVLSEDAPLADSPTCQQGHYSDAKTQQELAARRLCRLHNIRLSVLRLGAVCSAGGFETADLGPRLGPVQVVIAPNRILRLVKVEHVAETLVAACTTNWPDGLTVNLVDDDRCIAWQLAVRLCRDDAKYRMLLPLPYGLLIGVASLVHPLFKCTGLARLLPGLLIPSYIACRFKSVSFDTRIWRQYLPLSTSPRMEYPRRT